MCIQLSKSPRLKVCYMHKLYFIHITCSLIDNKLNIKKIQMVGNDCLP